MSKRVHEEKYRIEATELSKEEAEAKLKERRLPIQDRPQGEGTIHGFLRRYSPEETREQLLLVEQIMVQRPDLGRLMQFKLARANSPISRGRFFILRTKILKRWAEEDLEMRASWKSQGIRRLERWIYMCEKDPTLKSYERHKLIQGYHDQLMDIQGTREPLKLDLNLEVKETVLHLIMDMSEEQVAEDMEEIREMKRLAEEAKRLGLGTIDVTAEAAE
jgi:hypothetical protein